MQKEYRGYMYWWKNLSILLGLVLLINFFSGCSSLKRERSDTFDPQVVEEIQEVVEKGNLPSVQIAIIEKNQIVYAETYGSDSNNDSVYMNGSVQKVFDATAVLQLYEKGLLDIEADVNQYIPFKINHPMYPEIPITIKMLLSHRSGLDAFDYQFSWDTECLFYPEYRSECNPELVDLALEDFLSASFSSSGENFNPEVWLNQPEEKYHYSVSTYPFLRYLIEEVSGVSYPDYMDEHIFKPLGMLNSGFYAETFDKQHAVPHTRSNGENIPLPIWNGNGYMMRSTAEDMAKIMLVMMNDGEFKNVRILNPETIKLMQSKISRGRSPFNPSSELTDKGYGLGIIRYGMGWMGHGGSTVGYQSLWQFNASKKIGYVLLTNINGILGGRETFDSVWTNVASIRDILIAELDPVAGFVFSREQFVVLFGFWAFGFICFLIYRFVRSKRRA